MEGMCCTALNTLEFVSEVGLWRPYGGRNTRAVAAQEQCTGPQKPWMRHAEHKSQNVVGLRHCVADVCRKVHRETECRTQDFDYQSGGVSDEVNWACSSFAMADAQGSTLFGAYVEHFGAGSVVHYQEMLLQAGKGCWGWDWH